MAKHLTASCAADEVIFSPLRSRARDVSTPIKVNSIVEEYAYLRRVRCECSGQVRLDTQRMTEVGSTPVDIFEIVCEKCGQTGSIEFDISSFYGKLGEAVRGTTLTSEQEQQVARIADHILRKAGVDIAAPPITPASATATPPSTLTSARYPGATFLTILYTVYTWLPIILLLHVGNGWLGIPVKIGCVLWLLVTFYNLFYQPMLLRWIGAAGPGFLLNAILFAILNFWPPYWTRAVLVALIVFFMGATHFSISRRDQDVTADPNRQV
ncbi:MAG: hypothetical protein ABI972_04675 [Acidobacteriota bacterium]